MMTTRNYRHLLVKEATSEELLFELLQRNDATESPTKIELYTSLMATVGIGNDDVADIIIDRQSKQALDKMIAETNDLKHG